MKILNSKSSVDIPAMLMVVGAIITGFMLHNQVWHLHIYNDTALWATHETIGLLLGALMICHCVQHSFWVKNYAKIKPERKRVTTILLILSIIVIVSGIILFCGSHSGLISRIHYISGILFTLIAIGHVAKRWKLFKSLLPK